MGYNDAVWILIFLSFSRSRARSLYEKKQTLVGRVREHQAVILSLLRMGNPLSTLVAKLAFLPPPPSYDAEWKELVWITTKRAQTIAACYIPCPG